MFRKRNSFTILVGVLVCLSLTVWKLWQTKEKISGVIVVEETNPDGDSGYRMNGVPHGLFATYRDGLDAHEGEYNCQEGALCPKKYLSPSEMKDFEHCTRSGQRRGDIEPPSCRFVQGRQEIVALASFPGSGNTWVRGLLQKATGFCTGSLYCDTDLRRHGFSAEGVASPAVLVVKTHKRDAIIRHDWNKNRTNLKFSSAIVIVRNPFFALVSERHRMILHRDPQRHARGKSMHTSIIGVGYFGDTPEWNQFVQERIEWWKRIIRFWVIQWQHHGPLLVVKYEDLVEDWHSQVLKMAKFLKVEAKEFVNWSAGFVQYQRTHEQPYSRYTAKQVIIVNDAIMETHKLLRDAGLLDTLSVVEYRWNNTQYLSL